MKKMCLLHFLMLTGMLTAADKTLEAFPERTSLVAKINVNEIKKIDFINKMIRQGSNPKLEEARSFIKGYIGLDIYKISTVWMATGKNEEFLFIIKGNFDTLPVENSLREHKKALKVEMEGVYFACLIPDDDKPGKKNFFAVLNDNCIMFGEENFAREYAEVFTKQKKGLAAKFRRKVSLINQSRVLAHACTMNFVLPPKEKNNPVLKNIKQAELKVELSEKYVKFRATAEAHDPKNISSATQFLNIILKKQKDKPKGKNPLANEALTNSEIFNNSKEIILQTKVSRYNLSLMLEDRLMGLEAIFE